MLPKSELLHIVREQYAVLNAEDAIPRTMLSRIPKQSEFVTIITGVRRCGKSTLLKELIDDFDQVHYLNFEDFRLSGFQSSDFGNLHALFSEEKPNCNIYVFDEIQNAPGWENYIRTLNDSHKTVFITGSNSTLLSGELGTKLTGRHLDYELFPMDFAEFCKLTNRSPTVETVEAYLTDGGFPQYLKTGISEFLQQILTDVLYRDIIKRHTIRSISVLEDLTRFLVSNVAKEYSLRNISKTLNTFSIHTLSEFLTYLQDAYLFFSVPIFAYSLKKQAVNPRKIYSIDNGLTGANALGFTKDRGKRLENAVFLSIRRRFKEIYYFKGRGECDFIVKDKNHIHSLIQVCYQLTSDNLHRELRGIEEAMVETGCSNAFIVTLNENSEYATGAGPVQALSACDWFSLTTQW